MSVQRRVTVERQRLRFAAAHMATFYGDCEPLHGHNYDLTLEIEGELTEDSWVWDFGDLKRKVKELADELDHKFLLQMKSPHLEITELEDGWQVGFKGRRYVFPKSDVLPLPITNSTAEQISEWIAGRLLEHYRPLTTSFRKLTVGVEESPGQTGWYTTDV